LRRIFYEKKLIEIHTIHNIIEEKLGGSPENQEKVEISSQDKRMYKLFKYKDLNKFQKILYKTNPINEEDEKEKLTNELNLNEFNSFDYSSTASVQRRMNLSSKNNKILSNRPKSALSSYSRFQADHDNKFIKINDQIDEKFNEEKEINMSPNSKMVKLLLPENFNENDITSVCSNKKIYAMQESFWSRVLTSDIRDSTEISGFLFDPKNMVSLKNFKDISKKGQPKNPKIYFNHKIYREFGEDYKPKILTNRNCFLFKFHLFIKIKIC